MLNALLVGSGGFAGAILRYALSGFVHRHLPLTTFPYGTLCVNLLGCLLIGAFAGLADSRQLFTPELRAFTRSFLPLIDDAIVKGLATLEKVEVLFYRAGQSS